MVTKLGKKAPAKAKSSATKAKPSSTPSTPLKRGSNAVKFDPAQSDKNLAEFSTPLAKRSNVASPPLSAHAAPAAGRKATGITANTWLDLDDNEVTLRRFDMNMEYGPSSGLSRLDRWQRAEKLGKSPPKEILHLLQGNDVSKDGAWENVTRRILIEQGQIAA